MDLYIHLIVCMYDVINDIVYVYTVSHCVVHWYMWYDV